MNSYLQHNRFKITLNSIHAMVLIPIAGSSIAFVLKMVKFVEKDVGALTVGTKNLTKAMP